MLNALRVVQEQTGTEINLSRSGERNLIRNAGQYWKGPGLLEPTSGTISLTPFGWQVAQGRITESEFALAVAKTLTLPNPHIDAPNKVAEWKAAGLEIRPLELLLSILARLEEVAGNVQAYLTPEELIQIIIPLAGVKTSVVDHAETLLAYRRGDLKTTDWPDCAPAANDRRMADEFLLFLWHHGLCKCDGDPREDKWNRRFSLTALAPSDIAELEQVIAPNADTLATVRDVRASRLPATIESASYKWARVLSRPQQAKFRTEVLNAFNSTCLLTGERFTAALEAAHIRPKKNDGSDAIANGFCLRIDVHKLFDAGHIRIDPTGQIHLSDALKTSVSYNALPSSVSIPSFVSPQAIDWRWNYG